MKLSDGTVLNPICVAMVEKEDHHATVRVILNSGQGHLVSIEEAEQLRHIIIRLYTVIMNL